MSKEFKRAKKNFRKAVKEYEESLIRIPDEDKENILKAIEEASKDRKSCADVFDLVDISSSVEWCRYKRFNVYVNDAETLLVISGWDRDKRYYY